MAQILVERPHLGLVILIHYVHEATLFHLRLGYHIDQLVGHLLEFRLS